MNSAAWAVLAAATFIGHFSLAVWLFNRLHAKPWRRKTIGQLEKVLLATAAIVLLLYLWRYVATPAAVREYPLGTSPLELLAQAYAWICRAAFFLAIPLWLLPKLFARTPAVLVEETGRCVDIAARLGQPPVGNRRIALAAKIPANEIFSLSITHKTLEIAKLPPALHGLTIAHLSDLHMTGKITRPFYDEVVNLTNSLDPDLIAVTGDIAETETALEWVEPTLGRLRSRYGAYFVLGNHEQRLPDIAVLRSALISAGLVDISSRVEHRSLTDGAGMLIAGSEMPWFGRRPDVPPEADSGESTLRLLLSHTPDEYSWARQQRFDLMLAGHNHGGQIRLPYLGALIAPSRYGFRYAGGVYHEPPTVLHVSRGIAGLHSVRFNCAPELAILTLVGSGSIRRTKDASAARKPSATRA